TTAGNYTLKVRAEDNGGLYANPDKTVTITVAGNQPPVANSQSVTVTQDTPLAIVLTGSDPEGSSLTFSIVTNPSHGTLGSISQVNATSAQVTYTPTSGYIGSDSFTFRVYDGQAYSPAATVGITVNAPAALFTDVTATHLPSYAIPSTAASVGDYNGDGNLDVVVTYFGGASHILENDGTGSFTKTFLSSLGGPNAAYATKFIEHPAGRLDLYASEWQGTDMAFAKRMMYDGSSFVPVVIEENAFNGCEERLVDWSFGYDIEAVRVPASPYPHQVLYANLSNEQTVCGGDWVYLGWSGVFGWNDALTATDYLYPFYGEDGITPGWSPRTFDFEIADVDGDGDDDILSAGVGTYLWGVTQGHIDYYRSERPALWVQEGANFVRNTNFPFPSWNDYGPPSTSFYQRAQFANLNGDTLGGKEKMDFVLVDQQKGLQILRNTRAANGSGSVSFVKDPNPTGVVPQNCREVVIGKINNDNKPDLILISPDVSPYVKVFLNTTTPWPTSGQITFVEATNTGISISGGIYGGLLFDMDNDTDLDLFIHLDGQDRLYKNLTIP
ncbi:MAG: Ig-like domain-containing protein, partial [Candidatus Omnitrophota bacterium]